MALILSMKAGDSFFVGQRRFQVTSVRPNAKFTVAKYTSPKHCQMFNIDDTQAIEVMEDVFVSSGLQHDPVVARVVIDAPRSIEILRETVYREKYPEAAQVG